jgi:hypothetical protein
MVSHAHPLTRRVTRAVMTVAALATATIGTGLGTTVGPIATIGGGPAVPTAATSIGTSAGTQAASPAPVTDTDSAAATSTAGIAATPTGDGYWLAQSDGSVRAFGDADDRGSMAGASLQQPIVGIAATPTGAGYWLVARDGGIFSFGDAAFYGSTGDLRLNRPIVGMTSTASGRGYWLVASDGGIFAFGDAAFHGSTGALVLNRPITTMMATASGGGYWLLGNDGGMFAFGDAGFFGSTGGLSLGGPIVAAARSLSGQGYWLVGRDGAVYAFGDATDHGDATGGVAETVGIVTTATGYWVVAADGTVTAFPQGTALPVGPTPPAPGVPGTAARTTPAGPVAPPPGGPHNYMRLNNDGTPARYNPCQEIHYVLNLGSAPASARDDVAGAISRLANATGLTFVNDGDTTELPTSNRPIYDEGRYGDRWVPILISWVYPSQTNQSLGSGVLGLGGSTAVLEQGRWVYVTGQVTLNADFNASFGTGFGAGYTWGEVVMHEVSHVLGLHHVDSSAEIMYPTATSRVAEFGPGDLTGLYSLGTPAGCVAQPDPWWLRTSLYGTAGRGGQPAPATGDDLAQGAIAVSSVLPVDRKPLHCEI